MAGCFLRVIREECVISPSQQEILDGLAEWEDGRVKDAAADFTPDELRPCGADLLHTGRQGSTNSSETSSVHYGDLDSQEVEWISPVTEMPEDSYNGAYESDRAQSPERGACGIFLQQQPFVDVLSQQPAASGDAADNSCGEVEEKGVAKNLASEISGLVGEIGTASPDSSSLQNERRRLSRTVEENRKCGSIGGAWGGVGHIAGVDTVAEQVDMTRASRKICDCELASSTAKVSKVVEENGGKQAQSRILPSQKAIFSGSSPSKAQHREVGFLDLLQLVSTSPCDVGFKADDAAKPGSHLKEDARCSTGCTWEKQCQREGDADKFQTPALPHHQKLSMPGSIRAAEDSPRGTAAEHGDAVMSNQVESRTKKTRRKSHSTQDDFGGLGISRRKKPVTGSPASQSPKVSRESRGEGSVKVEEKTQHPTGSMQEFACSLEAWKSPSPGPGSVSGACPRGLTTASTSAVASETNDQSNRVSSASIEECSETAQKNATRCRTETGAVSAGCSFSFEERDGMLESDTPDLFGQSRNDPMTESPAFPKSPTSSSPEAGVPGENRLPKEREDRVCSPHADVKTERRAEVPSISELATPAFKASGGTKRRRFSPKTVMDVVRHYSEDSHYCPAKPDLLSTALKAGITLPLPFQRKYPFC